jgi:hypothetical protein
MNRTLVEMARMMLHEHRTPRRFWVDAISTTCYISNRIFMHSIMHLTPFELRFGRKPSVSHLRPSSVSHALLIASRVEGDIISEKGAPSHVQKAHPPQQIIGNRNERVAHISFP